jgi:hypothetical protein
MWHSQECSATSGRYRLTAGVRAIQEAAAELLPATPMHAAPVVVPPETIEKMANGFVGISGDFFTAIEARLKDLLYVVHRIVSQRFNIRMTLIGY